jgi:hypothetical protein
VKLRRESLLRLYDTKIDGRGSHISAITGLIGEDLLLALLHAYWRTQGYESRILEYRCKGKGLRGHRLDAWLLREGNGERTLFQTEVKNWAAYSLSERATAINLTSNELAGKAKEQWKYYFGKPKIPHPGVAKVLTPNLVPPLGYGTLPVRPLVCFWFVVSQSPPNCYSVQARAGAFAELHVFSGSLFLRGMREEHIDLTGLMPRATERLRLFEEIFVRPN